MGCWAELGVLFGFFGGLAGGWGSAGDEPPLPGEGFVLGVGGMDARHHPAMLRVPRGTRNHRLPGGFYTPTLLHPPQRHPRSDGGHG